jgi:NDP-sugar pyrophosphorylase family protein
MCPVGNVALLDLALARVARLGLTGPADVAVNASYLAEQVVAHAAGRAYLSVEGHPPLGTSGGVANLRPWIGGRAVLVANSDAYLAGAAVAPLLDGWDGTTVRLLGVASANPARAEFGRYRFAGLSLLPWDVVTALPVEPTELVRTVWRPAEAAGRLELVGYAGTFLDTGTPADYLAANLHAAASTGQGGNLVAPDAKVTGLLDRAVVGAGAVVEGALTRAVVWPGGYVRPGEKLVDAVRVGRDLTVPAPLG